MSLPYVYLTVLLFTALLTALVSNFLCVCAFPLPSAFKISHPQIKTFYFAAENVQEMNL